ncbi:UDP-2,4-diacetamido-2,4,6-trideoxy-beta-L-altropyranose hydrolase [Phaeovulum vinaykumarii]|nr:UDP-2,4-diacetamido-2,4,6-trideoxy-beta-L-altropyranose hydrolase [Phaeovulum vinaykumarii]
MRVDAGPQIGGGHLMRCLTLAGAARERGHAVRFIAARAELNRHIHAAGFPLDELAPLPHAPEAFPRHAHWLSLPWAEDARRAADLVAQAGADWLVVDHYGLDARWVAPIRAACPGLRVLALDDLDDRDTGADMVLDPGHLDRRAPRRHPVPATLPGPDFALLRPEFAAHRAAALARRGAGVRRVLILPGMMDAAGLAPLALDALAGRDLEAEVVMGASAQSVAAVRARIADRPGWSLTLDATDMAQRMSTADLCIGAGGGTSWERCCLGLPTLAVAVAENQEPGLAALAARGAVELLSLAEARDPARMAKALARALARAPQMAQAAAGLCDGRGAGRVLDALEGGLRPLAPEDCARLFEWRNQPHVRAASHNHDPLDPAVHAAWFARTLARDDGLWCVYAEGGRDLGLVSAVDQGAGLWRWSFYLGAPDAPPGAGGRMLAAFLRRLAAEPRCRIVEGEVLETNPASVTLHQRLGFAECPPDTAADPAAPRPLPGVLVFRRTLAPAAQHGATDDPSL